MLESGDEAVAVLVSELKLGEALRSDWFKARLLEVRSFEEILMGLEVVVVGLEVEQVVFVGRVVTGIVVGVEELELNEVEDNDMSGEFGEVFLKLAMDVENIWMEELTDVCFREEKSVLLLISLRSIFDLILFTSFSSLVFSFFR